MKNILSFGLVLAMGLLALVPVAQASLGFDTYKAARTYILTPPQNIVGNQVFVTNGPIDLVKMVGTGKIDFLTTTNTGATGGTLTATLYDSPDQTNLTAVSGYALVTSATTESITNMFYGGTNLVANNSLLLPYAVSNPNAAVTGYATPIPTYLPSTNSGAITLNGNKTVQVGLNLDDRQRYLYVIYATGGTITNFSTSATITTVPAIQ